MRFVLSLIILSVFVGFATADVFNMGSAYKSLEMVPIGNPGNVADTQMMEDGTNGYGAVNYDFKIGKYEVTAGQYCEFLNAIAATDTYELYNSSMFSNALGCKIQRIGSSGSYAYSVPADWANRPVNYISWGDAARFVNWLHNGQPVGTQNLATTEDGAYYLNGTVSDSALMLVGVRKSDAKYWIPNENEWYKAAYYRGSGVNAGYWLYPTQSNSVPGRDITELTNPGNNANYSGLPFPIEPSYYFTTVGEFQLSQSAYGTFDQGGNIYEWNETLIKSSERGLRGGSGLSELVYMSSARRIVPNPKPPAFYFGFRVASIPEPSTLAMLLSIAVGGFLWWKRRNA